MILSRVFYQFLNINLRKLNVKSVGHFKNYISSFRKVSYLLFTPTALTFVSLSATTSIAIIPKTMTENFEAVIQNADQLFDENKYQENYDFLIGYMDQSLPDIQWRKARALFSLAKTVKTSAEREKLIRDAFGLITSALESNNKNFAIHKWYSIILDAHAELDGIKARIVQLETVKTHMLKAVELNPQDPTSWHILGAFEYGLADLPWYQRKVVSTIFASPPTGTYEKALEYFQKAEEINEGFYSTNWLFIGKCLQALKKNEDAKQYLEKAANCSVLNEDDKNCKEEAVKLLKKL